MNKAKAAVVPATNSADDPRRILLRAFPTAEPACIDELALICSCLGIPGGHSIVLEGEPSEDVFIVMTGMFAAYKQSRDGREVLLNRMTAGAIIGEIGFITGAPRTAAVRAIRNSEVLRISKADLQAVAARHPSVPWAICTTLIERLQNAQAEPTRSAQLRTYCLLPADATIDGPGLMRKLARNFASFTTVTTVTAEQAMGQTAEWFTTLEQTFDCVLFLADCDATAWSRFCLRQADGVILMMRGDSVQPDHPLALLDPTQRPDSLPLFMILLWQDTIKPGQTSQRLARFNPKGHFHVRHDADLARAARLIAGRGVGLVLSGGGARGLAHVGVLIALARNHVPIDVIGGTSIGGVVAGLSAFEWDLGAMARSLATAFSRRRISDFAVPRTALFSGRTFARIFEWVGDTRMEDAPTPVFCVSTSLTNRVSVVHRTGRLETWLRATTAIPGIFPPLIENGAIYVDGGILNNLPVDSIRDFGVSRVVAVDVGSFAKGAEGGRSSASNLVSLPELLWRVGTIGNGQNAPRYGHHAGQPAADLVLRPAVAHISLFGWRASDEAIAAGQRVVDEQLPAIKAILADVS